MATTPYDFVPLSSYRRYDPPDMLQRARGFCDDIHRRRTVRDSSETPVDREVIEACVRAAGAAPSGANQQPWTFVCIANPALKAEIRVAAEEEERAFYDGRASDEWLDALAPLGTDAKKPFLETAPWLIAVFARRYGLSPEGKKVKHYYVPESVGLATGILITALHHAGLATLTHTPSPMRFLNAILGRPEHEKPFLLLVVGYPATDCKVPNITRKPLDEIAIFKE